MTRKYLIPALALMTALAASTALRADVKTQQKNSTQLGGGLGRMMSMFGKGNGDPVVSTVSVSGDRKMSADDAKGQIIDLREEKVYDLDMKKKSYTVTTFAELRKKQEEMDAKAKENVDKAPREDAPAQRKNDGKQMEFDMDVKNTGQTKVINGFDTHQVIVTVTMREKGKKVDESGGMVTTVDNWITKSQPALKEISDFDLRYAQALRGPMLGISPEQMAAASAMMPGIQEAMARSSKAGLDGTPIMMVTTVEMVKSPEQMAQQTSANTNEPQANPLSVGGALGGFMKRRQQASAEKEKAEKPASAPNRAVFMTVNHEVVSIATSVSAADVAIPAGFKLNK